MDCAHCGGPVVGRRIITGPRATKYCSWRCENRAAYLRAARRKGVPPDQVERECAVCYTPFITKRWNGMYCSPACRSYASHAAARARAGITPKFDPSPELIARRAAAIKAAALQKGSADVGSINSQGRPRSDSQTEAEAAADIGELVTC